MYFRMIANLLGILCFPIKCLKDVLLHHKYNKNKYVDYSMNNSIVKFQTNLFCKLPFIFYDAVSQF